MAYDAGGEQCFAALVRQTAGFFKRKIHYDPIQIYTETAAREAVRKASDPVLIWYNARKSALCITQRFGTEVVTEALPYKLSAKSCNDGKYDKGQITLQVQISGQDVNHFLKLTSEALPTWLEARHDALGRCMLLVQGEPWVLGYCEQRLMLQRADGSVAGWLQLDLATPAVTLEPFCGCKSLRPCEVASLSSALRLLKKHAGIRNQSEKALVHALQSVQLTPASVRSFRTCLESVLARSQARSEAVQQCVAASGIIPGLVDFVRCQQDQDKLVPLVADCIQSVLRWFGEHAGSHAETLTSCIIRGLSGPWKDVLTVVQLLHELLLRLRQSGFEESLEAMQNPELMQALMHLYSATLPKVVAGGGGRPVVSWERRTQQDGNTVISDLYNKGIPFRIGDPHSFPISCETPSPENSPSNSGSSASSSLPPGIIVPRLALPTLGCPQINLNPPCRSSRLSRRGEAGVAPKLETLQGGPAVTTDELYHLGSSSGEGGVAADLGAILRRIQVRRKEKVKALASIQLPAPAQTDLQPTKVQEISIKGCQGMPYSQQLQLHVLRCIQLLSESIPPEELCPSPTNLLLTQLLLPQSLLVRHFLPEAQADAGASLAEGSSEDPSAGQSEEALMKAIMAGLQMQRALAMKLVARAKRINHRDISSDDTLDVRPKLYDGVIAQVKTRLKDYGALKHPDASVFIACQDLLLLLRDYLVQVRSGSLVDVICNVVADALAEVEHTLRSAGRVALWPAEAVPLMGGLMQLYSEMLRQARTGSTISYLHELVGAKVVSQLAQSTSGAGGNHKVKEDTPKNTNTNTVVASDTLQLLLDLVLTLRRRTIDTQEPQGTPREGSKAMPLLRDHLTNTNGGRSSGDGSASGCSAGGPARDGTIGAVVQGWGTPEQIHNAGVDEAAGAVFLAELQCWQMLTALVEFSVRNPETRPADGIGRATSTEPLSSRCCSVTPSAAGAAPSLTPNPPYGQKPRPANVPHLALTCLSTTGQLVGSPTRGGLGTNRMLAAPGSPGPRGSPTASLAGSNLFRLFGARDASSTGSRTARSQDSDVTASEAADGLGPLTWRCNYPGAGCLGKGGAEEVVSNAGGLGNALLGVLVDKLLRQGSSQGCAAPCTFVLQQLKGMEAQGQPLQTQVQLLDFISAAFSVPGSYAYHVPHLAEYYVRYHFGQFLRLYYAALPIPPGDIIRCRGHLKVLLTLTRHITPGNCPLRRTFVQWRVLDHLVHMLSLEHSLLHTNFPGRANSYSNPNSARTSTYDSPHGQTPGRRLSTAGFSATTPRLDLSTTRLAAPGEGSNPVSARACEGGGGHLAVDLRSPLGSGRKHSVDSASMQPRPPTLPKPSLLARQAMVGRRQGPVPTLTIPGAPPSPLGPSEAASAFSFSGHCSGKPTSSSTAAAEGSAGHGIVDSEDEESQRSGGRTSRSSGSEEDLSLDSSENLYNDLSDDGSDDGEAADWSQCVTPGGKLKLTGDMSFDLKLITQWERHTGKEYELGGLSDEEDDGNDCNRDSQAAALGCADVQREASFTVGVLAGGSSSNGAVFNGVGCQPPVPVLAMHRMGAGLHCPMESAPLAVASSSQPATGRSTAVPAMAFAGPAAAGKHSRGEEAACGHSEEEQLGFGYDMDEDVERLLAAEEAGITLAAAGIPEHYASTLNEDGASSSSSELIAAGRHVEEAEEDEEHLQRWGSGGSEGLPADGQAPMVHRSSTTGCSSSSGGTQDPVTPAEKGRTVPQLSLAFTSTPGFGRTTTPGTAFAFQKPPASASSAAGCGFSLDAMIAAAAAGGGGAAAAAGGGGAAAAAAAPGGALGTGGQQQKRQQQQQQPPPGECPQSLSAWGVPDSARSAPDAGQVSYRCSRELQALYDDDELHGLLVQLALQLITTPSGSVDPLYLPKEPNDISLQKMVMVLLDHFCHPDNWSVVQQLHASNNNLVALTASGSSSDSPRPDPAAAVAASCATSAVRLLKLTAAGLFNMSAITWGSLIKSGGYGEIHAATMKMYDGKSVPVAIKSVDVTCTDQDASNFERVYTEITTLSSLQGLDGVVPLLDFGLSYKLSSGDTSQRSRTARYHLVFPRFDCSLREWRRSHPEIDLNDPSHVHLLLDIFRQVLLIVSAVHSANVVHFDIKGDNLLVKRPTPGDQQKQQQAQLSQAGFSTPRTPMDAALFARAFYLPDNVAAGACGGGLYSSPATPAPATTADIGISSSTAASGGGFWAGYLNRGTSAAPAGGSTSVHSSATIGSRIISSSNHNGSISNRGIGSSTARPPEEPVQLVLADFGDAVMFGDRDDKFTHKHRGTELFSSPEMLLLGRHKPDADSFDRRKHKGAGVPHDVWSCGCTLYELLTGEVLFQEEGVPRVLAVGNSARGTPVLNARDRQRLQRKELIDLLEYTLEGSPNLRPGVQEVKNRVERVMGELKWARKR